MNFTRYVCPAWTSLKYKGIMLILSGESPLYAGYDPEVLVNEWS